MANEIKKSDFIQSLEKGLKVIEAFDADHQHLTLTEVAKLVDLTRANARRVLLTLEYLGYVYSDGKYFSLSPKILGLGYSYLSTLSFRELAQPFLSKLANSVNESCSMSVLDGKDVVYIARVQTSRIMTIALSVGTRLPAYAASMGRVLMADLEEDKLGNLLEEIEFEQFTSHTITNKEALKERIDTVRKRGWAIADQELEIGVRSIASPIKDKYGKTIAALNISGHATRITKNEMIKTFLPKLKSTVAEIEAAIYQL